MTTWTGLAIAYGLPLMTSILLIYTAWRTRSTPVSSDLGPGSRYFLKRSSSDVHGHSVVPPGAIYVEAWTKARTTLCVVRYAGEPLPSTWTETPWDRHPRTPWIWIGDRASETDLTRSLRRFLVVGNRVTPDLIATVSYGPLSSLMYIEAGTFKERSFPAEGITIEEYVDKPLCDRGPVHCDETAVCTPVVGEHTGSSE